jgi:hypothetical protein
MTKDRWRRGSAARLVIGLFLLGLGALMLAGRTGFDAQSAVWRYWPLLLVGLGLVKILWPADGRERVGGFWFILSGAYCWVSVWNLFGLHWGTAWPIFLVGGGVMMIFDDFGFRDERRKGGGRDV